MSQILTIHTLSDFVRCYDNGVDFDRGIGKNLQK